MAQINLEKAKGKSLAAHFKKAAAFHNKMADTHEKCAKANEAAQEHHEGMMVGMKASEADNTEHGSSKADKGHHKAMAAFHKTMAGHHNKMKQTHDAHGAHNEAMATAHNEASSTDDTKKALILLEIDMEEREVIQEPVVEKVAEVVVDAKVVTEPVAAVATETKVTPQGDPMLTTTDEAVKAAAASVKAAQEKLALEKSAAAVAAAATVNPAVAAVAAPATQVTDNVDLNKALETGLGAAITAGLDNILKSPEFGIIVQEKLAAMMLEKLSGQKIVQTEVKTFAVPRRGSEEANKAAYAMGGSLVVEAAANVDPQFADLVSMSSD